MYFTYVLWSSKIGKRYVGATDNVEKRLHEHNLGGNKFTKGGIPWILIRTEEFATKTEALQRENFLKSGQGRKWLDENCSINWKGAGVV